MLVHVDRIKEALPESRRNQYKPNLDLKRNVISAILHSHVRACVLFKVPGQSLNISLMSQLTNHLVSLHHSLRQASNPTRVGRIGEKISEVLTIHDGENEYSCKKEDISNMMILIFRAYELEYKFTGNTPPEWYGVASPYFTFLSGFTHRMNEVRTGCEYFPVGKVDDKVQVARVSQYRLSAAHHPFLDGITYPPHKRSAMAQSVGPLTQLIMLNRSKTTSTFADRWVKAASRSLSHLPKYDELIAKLKVCLTSEAGDLLELIGDILLITQSRASNKAFFPFPFYHASLKSEEIDTYQKDPVGDPDQGADFRKYLPLLCELSAWVDHSGKGAFFLWKTAVTQTITLRLNTDSAAASEIVFHSVWGSHWEDLEILKYMTGHDFRTRRALADAFRGKGTTAN